MEFPQTSYLTSVCTCPEWILSPEAKVISLPLSLGNLAHFSLTMAMQHFKSALGYPTWGFRVERECVGYPSAPPSNYHPTVKRKCARIVQLAGRWLKSDSGVRISSGQMRTEAGYLGRRKLLSHRRTGLFLDLGCQLENGNFQKFSQYFLSKLSFDKLSWVFEFCLRIFFGFLSKVVFWVQVRVFME